VKCLLDTHAFLWMAGDPARLSAPAREACASGELWLSVASIWEIAIKVQIGRLKISYPIRTFIARQLTSGQISVLPIHTRHIFRLSELPLYHRDPFDRLLAAQSLEEELPLISRDPVFPRYEVQLLW
jgi:PIN domain nuclease of toxin-antitoxin system